MYGLNGNWKFASSSYNNQNRNGNKADTLLIPQVDYFCSIKMTF